MCRSARTAYAELLTSLNDACARFAVLGTGTLELDGVAQGTVDLGLAVDVAPDNMRALVDTLGELGFRFRQQAAPLHASGQASEVVALTFGRGAGCDADVHIVLAPPAAWRQLSAALEWRPFGDLLVPTTGWEALLELDAAARRTAATDDVAAAAQPLPMRLARRASRTLWRAPGDLAAAPGH